MTYYLYRNDRQSLFHDQRLTMEMAQAACLVATLTMSTDVFESHICFYARNWVQRNFGDELERIIDAIRGDGEGAKWVDRAAEVQGSERPANAEQPHLRSQDVRTRPLLAPAPFVPASLTRPSSSRPTRSSSTTTAGPESVTSK